MKNILKVAALLIVLQLSACKDDNESGGDPKTTMLTATPWGHAQVMHNPDGDLSDQYTNFVLAFTAKESDGFDGTFLVSNGGHAFSMSSGKWRFSEDGTQIILDSGREISAQVTEQSLRLDFFVPPTNGRVNGLSGDFIFELKPL